MPEPLNTGPSGSSLQDDLVAYLDRELPPEERTRIERVLAEDSSARLEVQRLEEVWEALELLPRGAADAKSARETVELVAQAAHEDLLRQTAARPRLSPKWLAFGIALALVLLAGWALGRRVWPDPNQRLLKELPIVQHFDEYRSAGNIEFLRVLEQQGLFTETSRDDKAAP